MENEKAVILLIEDELYRYIIAIKDVYTGEEAESKIQKFKEDFKETVLKKYPVDNIDGLIEKTLRQMNIDKNEKEIAD